MFVTAQLPEDILLGGQSPTPCGSLGSRSGLQTWRQMFLPVERCCQPNRAFWVKSSSSSAHALFSAPWLAGSWGLAEWKHCSSFSALARPFHNSAVPWDCDPGYLGSFIDITTLLPLSISGSMGVHGQRADVKNLRAWVTNGQKVQKAGICWGSMGFAPRQVCRIKGRQILGQWSLWAIWWWSQARIPPSWYPLHSTADNKQAETGVRHLC